MKYLVEVANNVGKEYRKLESQMEKEVIKNKEQERLIFELELEVKRLKSQQDKGEEIIL